jgi:hypothetical protein
MPKLIALNDINDIKLLDEILYSEIIIFEDIQGSKIFVNYDGDKFIMKAKSLSSEPINLIDLSLQNYYNHAISFFDTIDNRVKSLLNKKWWFCFELFVDNQPGNIEYNRIPKNHLVLTGICKGNKFNYTMDELHEYARLLDVDVIPVIFQGKLNEKAIEAIKYFLNTSESDLEYVFGEKSFTYFFYKILNPQMQNSFLMEDDFQKNLEKLIIKINSKNISFQILNPLYKKISDENQTDFVEIYTLILVNFLTFCQSINLKEIKIKGNRRDEAYLYLINKLYNIYIGQVRDDIMKFDFIIPEFFDKDKFRVNIELIDNKLTKQYVLEDKKLEYMYKIIIGSFNKPKKKPIGLFTDGTVKLFNLFVKSIQDKIDDYFNKKSEIDLTKSGLIDFGEFIDLKWDRDSEENVYPDVYTELEKTRDSKDKKGKGKGIDKVDYSQVIKKGE